MTRTALKMNPDLATLMHSALFSHLSRKAASTLAGSALLKTYLEGDVIFRQQEQAHFFCVVLRGYVRLTRTCDSGRIASLRICEPGDVFEIESEAFGLPLRNALAYAPEESVTVTAL